jgi:hypothetical protein
VREKAVIGPTTREISVRTRVSLSSPYEQGLL